MYDTIQKYKTDYFKLLKIEEIYFNLIKNYKEFEMTVFEFSLDSVLFRDYSWDSFKENIHEYDRVICNFLSQVRLYIDQSKKSISDVFGTESEEYKYFQKLSSNAYDTTFAYRLMEALRNHTQHNGLPVGSTNLEFSNVEVDGEKLNKATCLPYLNYNEIINNKKFKASIRKELKSYGEKVSLNKMMKEYFSELNSIRYLFNKFIQKYYDEIIENLEKLKNYYSDYDLEEIRWIEVVVDNVSDEKENIVIDYETLERYKKLSSRMNTYNKLSKTVIII
jgi:hypothetical protein